VLYIAFLLFNLCCLAQLAKLIDLDVACCHYELVGKISSVLCNFARVDIKELLPEFKWMRIRGPQPSCMSLDAWLATTWEVVWRRFDLLAGRQP